MASWTVEKFMSTTLRFRHHEHFHRAALHMAVFGAGAGLIAATAFGSVATPWVLGIIALAAAIGAMKPADRRRPLALAVRVALVGVGTIALATLPDTGRTFEGILLFAAGFAGALSWGLKGKKLIATLAVGIAVALIARSALASMLGAEQLATLPGWLVTTLGGAAFSFVSAVALVPRHIEVAHDHVGDAYGRIKDKTSGEVYELVVRGHGVWTKVAAKLPEGDANRELLEEAVIRLFGTAERWSSVNADYSQTMAASLVDRMQELEGRIAATKDEEAKTQYQQAHDALAEQLRYTADISTSRERVLARMHNYLAAMERLRMAVINLESASVSRESVDVAPIVSTLRDLGEDIDTYSNVLAHADLAKADSAE
jgi:hypothetical protein